MSFFCSFLATGLLFYAAMHAHGAWSQEAVVKQVLEAQPIISVDDAKVTSGTGGAPVVDTELPSPIAPQSFDGYDGVVQEPFAPTVVEKQAMIKAKRDEELKEQELAAKKEREKIKADLLEKKKQMALNARKKPTRRVASQSHLRPMNKMAAKAKVISPARLPLPKNSSKLAK